MYRKPHRSAGLVVAAACLLAAQQEPVIRVDVSLVRILATVKNTAGQLVGTLNKDDFQVLDNGVPQQIAVFEHHTALPLSVAMLVDTSGSTAKDLRYELESVNRFFKALFSEGNPEDKVALYSFNWEVRKWNSFTHNPGTLEKSLRGFKAEAGTAMYDAIYLASQDLEGRQGRHVMIIVTDGGDTISNTTYHQALQAAQMADTGIYPVLVMPITADAGRNIGGENALATIAASTGGRVFAPSIGPALDAAFSEIIRELRTQYLLGYYPKNLPETKDKFHRLQVKVRRPDLQVLARSGYYGDSGSAAADADARVTVTPQKKQEK